MLLRCLTYWAIYRLATRTFPSLQQWQFPVLRPPSASRPLQLLLSLHPDRQPSWPPSTGQGVRSLLCQKMLRLPGSFILTEPSCHFTIQVRIQFNWIPNFDINLIHKNNLGDDTYIEKRSANNRCITVSKTMKKCVRRGT